MPRQRLLLFICGSLTVLLLLGGLIGALLRLINELRYSLEYFIPYWLVSPILLLAAGLLLTLLVQIGWPWWKSLMNRQEQKYKSNIYKDAPPKSRQQAARRSLQSIDLLLERLQDNVSRKALKQERERVARELDRGDLIVVVS